MILHKSLRVPFVLSAELDPEMISERNLRILIETGVQQTSVTCSIQRMLFGGGHTQSSNALHDIPHSHAFLVRDSDFGI